MGDPVEKIIDTAEDVVKSDVGKAVALGTAAYFGAPYLTGAGAAAGAAETGSLVYGGLDAAAITAASEAGAFATGAGAVAGGAGLVDKIKTVATVLSPVASISSVAASMKAAKMAAPGAGPMISPLAQMPSYPSPIVNKAMRGSVEQQVRRRGRMSTILTDFGDKLGS